MSTASTPRSFEPALEEETWSFGVTTFAAITLVTLSIFQILQAIAAIARDEVFVTGINYAYAIDISTWGWIHLTLGIIALAVGLGLLAGQTWARVAGIMVAVLVALANFASLPYYPLWSILVIAF
ncbi:MAG: DUF7144 family membrane protein, partial [Nocardioides sp.]